MSTTSRPGCDFEATIGTLGRKHVLDILRSLGERGPWRFNELKETLEVNPRTLTARLLELQQLGVVERRVHRVVPRKVEYALTPMGRDLVVIFHTLHQWKAKYSHGASPAAPSGGPEGGGGGLGRPHDARARPVNGPASGPTPR